MRIELRLIEVPGGLEGFTFIARSNRRPAWSAIPTQAATAAEISLAGVIAGHFGFVAPVALPEPTASLAAMGLPTILSAAALIGFGLTGEPAEPATDEAWGRWIGLGMSGLIDEPLANLVQTIAIRFPNLRHSLAQPAELAFPDRPDIQGNRTWNLTAVN